MAKSTNIMLFAVVIMLFAIVFHLVSTGMDGFTFVFAIVGIVVGLAGLFWDDRRSNGQG